jgi:hypothetical protein
MTEPQSQPDLVGVTSWAELADGLAALKIQSGRSYAEIARAAGRAGHAISKGTAENLSKGKGRPNRMTLQGYLHGNGVDAAGREAWLRAWSRLASAERGRRPVPERRPRMRADRLQDGPVLRPYLEYLCQRWKYLDLSILSHLAASPEQRGFRRTMADQFVEPHLTPVGGMHDPIPASVIHGRSPMAAVVGEPGTGKSTLLQYMAWMAADASVTSGRLRVPFLIQVPDLMSWDWAEDRDVFPFAFVAQEAVETGLRMSAGDLHELLAVGACLFLFDGVDEAGPDMAATLLKRVRSLVIAIKTRYRGNHVVVSTRPTFLDPLVDLELDTYWLDGFTWPEVEQFARKWEHSAVGMPATRHSLLTSVRDPRVRRLMTRPLYLTIVALLHDGQHGLAVEQRDDIFRMLTDHMLKRDQHKGARHLDIAAPTRTRRFRLEQMALWMQHQADSADFALSVNDIEDRLVDYLVSVEELRPSEATREAEAFLQWCVHRSGFVAVYQRGYSFQHPLVQQYLASCALYRDSEDAGVVGDTLTPMAVARANDPHWTEVILFLASQLNKSAATRLVAAVGSARAGYEDLSRRGVLTAVRIMAECHRLSRDVRQATLQALWNELDVGPLEQAGQHLSGSWRRVYREGLTLLPTLRGTDAEDDAVTWLVSRVSPAQPSIVRARACELLGALGSGDERALTALLAALRAGEEPTVQDNARRALANIGRSQESALVAIEALATDESADPVGRWHAGRALMQVHRRYDLSLRLGLAAPSHSRVRHFLQEWLRLARDGAADPYSSWDDDLAAVVAVLTEARRTAAPPVQALAGRLLEAIGADGRARPASRGYDGKAEPAGPASGAAASGLFAGEVLHYWPRAGAGVVGLVRTLEVGAQLRITSPESRRGGGTPADFRQQLESMEVEHERVREVAAGTHVAIQFDQQVRPGDRIYVIDS